MPRRECRIEWCREESTTKGLCATHFTDSWRRPRSPTRPPKPPKPPKPQRQAAPAKKPGPPKVYPPRVCSVDGCGLPHKSKGLCAKHDSARRYDAKRIDRSARPTRKSRIIEKAKRAAAIKIAAGCVDCGYKKHDFALDFDHLPGFTKVAGISKMVKDDASWESIEEEIAKCDVVCARCHRVRTHERRTVNRMSEIRKPRKLPQVEGRRPKVCGGCNKVFRDTSTNNNKKWCTDNCRRATAYRLRLWPSQWRDRK